MSVCEGTGGRPRIRPYRGEADSRFCLNEILRIVKRDERLTQKHVDAFLELVADRKNLLAEVQRLNEIVHHYQGPM